MKAPPKFLSEWCAHWNLRVSQTRGDLPQKFYLSNHDTLQLLKATQCFKLLFELISRKKIRANTFISFSHQNVFFHIFPTQHFLFHTVDGRNPKTTTRDVYIKPVVNNGISATNLNWISSINHPVFGLPAKSNFWPLALVCQALAAIGTDCWEGDAS